MNLRLKKCWLVIQKLFPTYANRCASLRKTFFGARSDHCLACSLSDVVAKPSPTPTNLSICPPIYLEVWWVTFSSFLEITFLGVINSIKKQIREVWMLRILQNNDWLSNFFWSGRPLIQSLGAPGISGELYFWQNEIISRAENQVSVSIFTPIYGRLCGPFFALNFAQM